MLPIVLDLELDPQAVLGQGGKQGSEMSRERPSGAIALRRFALLSESRGIYIVTQLIEFTGQVYLKNVRSSAMTYVTKTA